MADYDYSTIRVSGLRLHITYHDYDYNYDYSVMTTVMITIDEEVIIIKKTN